MTPLKNSDFSGSIVFLNIKNRKSTKGLSNDFPKHSFDYIIKFEGWSDFLDEIRIFKLDFKIV